MNFGVMAPLSFTFRADQTHVVNPSCRVHGGAHLTIAFAPAPAFATALSLCNYLLLLFDGSFLLGIDKKDPASDEERFLKYAQIILADAAAIHSSLAELGPGFVDCHFYDDMADEDQAQEIAEFLAPSQVVAGYLKDALLKNAQPRNDLSEDLPYPDAFAVTERIQRKLNAIEAQNCGQISSRRR